MAEDELYRKLQQHLDRMPVPFPATESGIEIRLLQQLFSPQEARVALCLSAIPEPAGRIHKRIRQVLTREALVTILGAMAKRGLIQYHQGPRGPRYGKSPFVVGIYEAQLDRLTPEVERDVRQYMDEAFGKALHSLKTPQMRTVPMNVKIVPERGVARYDDIREVVRASEGPFAVMNCICRQGRSLVGEPCRQTTATENCLTFGVAARAMVEHGVARFVSREEMLQRLDDADREGLVLEPQNTEDPLFVCCCCGCCCGVLTTAKKLPRPAEFFGTNYYAVVDAALCQVCATCVPRCQMDAITADTTAAQVDLLRCIGCGLCVSTCPSGAVRLEKKEQVKCPPKDMQALYKKLFVERYGPLGTAVAVGKSLLGMKV